MSTVPETLREREIDADKQYLQSLLKEKMRRRGLSDLRYFAKKICGYQDLTGVNGFHGDYCRHLEDKDYKFKLSLTPRGSLKSTIGTIAGSLQEVTKNPNIRILLASEKYSNSVKFLSEIKGHIEKNEIYKSLYGDLKGDKWTEGEIIVSTRTHWKKEPTITCAGIDVTKVGMHYDRIKIDDPHSEQNITSQEQIDKVIRWYRLLLSLLDPGGYVDVTGTIWHYADLYNYIETKEKERVDKGRKPRYKIFKRDSFIGSTEQLLNGEIEEEHLLWPERLTAEFLADQYLEQGPYIFSCQYRLNPIDDENATFKRSWMQGIDPDVLAKEVRKRNGKLNIYCAVDPMRDEEGKDFLAIPTVAVDENYQMYIMDHSRMKANEYDTVEEMFRIQKKWQPIRMGVETVAWQKSFYNYVKMLGSMKSYRLPMTELKTDTKVTKRMRIKSLVPYFRAGLIKWVCKDGDINNLKGDMAILLDEFTRYPKVANDDGPDALAYIPQLAKVPGVMKILKRIPSNSFMAIRNRLKTPKADSRIGSFNVRKVNA